MESKRVLNHGQQLLRDGYVVICNQDLAPLQRHMRHDLIAEAKNFQEFKTGVKQYVLGGFGALGNPSSFHNPTVRRIREWSMVAALPTFRQLLKEKKTRMRLEQIPDRMMIRLKGQSPSKESWHRDIAKNAVPTDMTFGGWLNLDPVNQYFSCVPGSHTQKAKRTKKGFAPIPKSEHKRLKADSRKIAIPPGCIIIFFEHIVHEVFSSKAKDTIVRVFLGWRLTKDNAPLIPGTMANLDNQAPMRLKSNQDPPMYAALHWTNWRNKLQAWSDASVVEVAKELKRVMSKTSNHYGAVHNICRRVMPSLVEMGLRKYSEYTQRERQLYSPNYSWLLLDIGRKRVMKQHRL